MRENWDYCEQQVREGDKDRFLATLFAPQPLRRHLYALYAFDLEIAQVRDRISSAFPGEVRLQWWRDVLTKTRRGEAAGNPIAAALLETLVQFDLSRAVLVDLIDAHTFDLYDEPMATLAGFERYAHATASAVFGCAARILGAPTDAEVAQHAGIARAITTTLLHLPRHAAHGQCYVPADILSRHDVAMADVFSGRTTAALRAALGELRQIARDHLAALRARAGDIPRELVPALLPLAPIPATLAKMDRADPFQPALPVQWRRQWMMWRAARRPAQLFG